MHPDTYSSDGATPDASRKPAVVEVEGSGATADKPVEMIEGATGARIPTGDHPRSGAMPDEGGRPAGGSLLGVVIGALALVVVLVVLAKLLT
jgi:hypothetical protein